MKPRANFWVAFLAVVVVLFLTASVAVYLTSPEAPPRPTSWHDVAR